MIYQGRSKIGDGWGKGDLIKRVGHFKFNVIRSSNPSDFGRTLDYSEIIGVFKEDWILYPGGISQHKIGRFYV